MGQRDQSQVSRILRDGRHSTTYHERITVAGPGILGVRLTAAAYAHGLTLAG